MKQLICIVALAATAMSVSHVDLLKSSNEQFTANMFQEVVKAKLGENVVLSAFSVLSPLAQLAIASVGESREEILKAIGLPNNKTGVFTELSEQLRFVEGVELNLTNRLYVRKEEVLNKPYATVFRHLFNLDVKNVDFIKSDEAAQEINKWVEDNTNHYIKDLVSPTSLNASTIAVLVNAIYFKGKWKKPFEKHLTEDKKFYVSKNQTMNVPTMSKSANCKYGESTELDAKLLELPYEGDQSSLLIVLPNEIEGMNSLLEKLKDPSILPTAVGHMYINEVNVELPKFKIETTTDLGEVLKTMNIVKLFIPGEARLDNLLEGQSDLHISSAIQKAYIEVNEEGAEAAAANDVSLDVRAGFNWTAEFVADHPFVFAILYQNNERKLNVFTGMFVK